MYCNYEMMSHFKKKGTRINTVSYWAHILMIAKVFWGLFVKSIFRAHNTVF